jgi:hypothetical protein
MLVNPGPVPETSGCIPPAAHKRGEWETADAVEAAHLTTNSISVPASLFDKREAGGIINYQP